VDQDLATVPIAIAPVVDRIAITVAAHEDDIFVEQVAHDRQDGKKRPDAGDSPSAGRDHRARDGERPVAQSAQRRDDDTVDRYRALKDLVRQVLLRLPQEPDADRAVDQLGESLFHIAHRIDDDRAGADDDGADSVDELGRDARGIRGRIAASDGSPRGRADRTAYNKTDDPADNRSKAHVRNPMLLVRSRR